MKEETENIQLKKNVGLAIIRAIKWPFNLSLKGALLWNTIALVILASLLLLPGNIFTWPLWLSLPVGVGFALTITVIISASLKDVTEAKALKETQAPRMLQEDLNPPTPDPDAED